MEHIRGVNVKRAKKTVVSVLIILFFFYFNVTVDFNVLINNAQNGQFVQGGPVKAYAAALYSYSKYTAVSGYAENWVPADPGESPFSGYVPHYGYPGYTFNNITGKFTLTGENRPYWSEGTVGYLISGGRLYRSICYESDSYRPADKNIPVSAMVRGSLVTSVLSPLGIYPDNGIYSDGYWYVKGAYVTNTPTILISSPSPNSIYNSSFAPSIAVSDVDGDIVTCKYYLDSSTTPKDTKQVSNTATAQNVSFEILDTSALGEGSHTITFEVSDGKAPPVTQTVTFYIDRTPPVIETMNCTSSETSVTIAGSVKAGTTDLHVLPYRYTVNGVSSAWTADTSYSTGSLAPNTKYTVKFEARDKFENTSSRQQDIYTRAQKPSLFITGNTETTLNLSISDANPAGTEYQIKAGAQYVNSSGSLTDTAQWLALAAKNITIKGLQPNTGYTVSVKARNAQGTESDAAQVVKTTLAKAPDITFGEIKQTSIKLAWNAVAGATAYEVEADDVNKGQVTGTEYIHGSLTPETEHRYRIRVINAGGTGNWGNYFTAGTLPYAPEPPKDISAVEAQTTITLTWDKSAKASSYEIEIDAASVPVSVGNALTYVHKGLVPDTKHTYRVRAKNAGGVSEWSSAVSATTLPEAPPTPGGIKIQKTNTSVTISWQPAARAESYRIEADGLIVDNGTATSFKQEGLSPLSSHKYRVKAINRGGSSEWSEIVLVITNPDKPGAPSNVMATADETSISLTWYEVPYAESYVVEIDGSSTESTTGAAFVHGGLGADNSPHTYRIKALNVSGQSEWSKPVTISTFPKETGGEPGEPGDDTGNTSLTNVIAVVTNNTVLLSWDDVAHDGTYEIEVDGKIIDNGKSTVYNHTGLTAETYHTYKIRLKSTDAGSTDSTSGGGINGSSIGKWCAVLSLSTLPDIPDAPKGLTATASDRSIELRWDKVEGATGYEVEMDGTVADAGAQEGYIQQPLEPGTTHAYRVRARNISGVTAWSETISQSTTNPIYTVGCKKGEELSLSLVASNVQDFTGFKVVVTYNSDELELTDLCGFTPDRDTMSKGAIPDTKLSVQYKPGRIEFIVNESITPGTIWSGEITNIVFMPKFTGSTKLNFTQE
jgi:hypothetical protein